MSVTVAKTAGFCFGVRRAVDLAEQQTRQGGEIYAYGEIIHNMHEIARLEKMGVHTAGRDPGRRAGAHPRARRGAVGLRRIPAEKLRNL